MTKQSRKFAASNSKACSNLAEHSRGSLLHRFLPGLEEGNCLPVRLALVVDVESQRGDDVCLKGHTEGSHEVINHPKEGNGQCDEPHKQTCKQNTGQLKLQCQP